MNAIRTQALNGIFWSLSERIGLQIVQFIISIVLARLLLPEQFGLIGMLSLFMAIAQSLTDSGFGSALIQKRDADRIDESSVFFLNLILGILLYGILYFSAPLIASFYQQPLLVPLTRFLSLNIIINSFSLIQTTILSRQVDFKTLLKSNLVSVALSGIVGVILAYRGFGVWSLAIQSVLSTLLRTVFLWLLKSWRPIFSIRLSSLSEMFSFGSKLVLASLLETFFQNIYQTFIGKVYPAAQVGYYTRAITMQNMAAQTVSSTIGRVMYPILSSISKDRENLKETYKKTLTLTAFIHFPIMLGLAAIARPLFLLLLTEKWQASIPYFQLLCFVGLLYPLHALNLEILKVNGRSDLYFRLEVIKKAIVLISILINYRYGIFALILGDLVVSIIALFLNSYYSSILINYPIQEQVRDFFPPLLISAVAFFVAFHVGNYFQSTALIALLIQGSAGLSLYIVISYVAKIRAFSEISRYLKTNFAKLGRLENG